MLSRVADALYWMGRYMERAEHGARALGVAHSMLLDLAEVQPSSAEAYWTQTLRALSLPELRLADLVFDEQGPSSILASVSRARENSRQVREVISSEMWEELNELYWLLKDAAHAESREEDLAATLAEVVAASFAFAGVTDGTMRRGEGWLFTKLGQFVERADKVSRMVRMRVSGLTPLLASDENLMWVSLLRSCNALEAFRKVHPTRLDSRQVIDFLVLDREFPHTIRYSVAVAGDFARRLAQDTGDRGREVERAFGRLASRLSYIDVDEVLAQGVDPFLDELTQELSTAGLTLQRTYFLH